jgi:competence protein ComEC
VPLLYISIAWLAGIFIGSLITLPAWALLLPLPFLLSAIFLRNHRRLILTAGFCLLALCGGILRYASSIQVADNSSLQFYNGKGPVIVEGMIADSPETRTSSMQFRLSAVAVTSGNHAIDVKGDVLVRVPFYREFGYGDTLQLTGKLDSPAQFEDFDYRSYLANKGIYSIMNYPQVHLLRTGRGFEPLSWIYQLRNRLADSLAVSLAEPQGSLAQAILLGLRGNLPDPLVQSFYRTGTTHLIAISGLNLTIILGMLLPLAVRLFGRRNRIYIWVSLSLIWFYTLLTGFPPTMVRAVIMGSIFLLAEMLGRQRNALAAMSFAAATMVAAEPGVLWDASFQLSYLSMLGLVLVSPYLIRFSLPPAPGANKRLESVKNVLATSFGITLSAIIATWPVTVMDFHSFSLAGAPATFFAMPSFPAIILISMLTAFAGLLWQPLAMLLGWAAWLFLSYFILIVNIFGSIPVANVPAVDFQLWQAVLYYLGLAVALLALKNLAALLGRVRELVSHVISLIARLRYRSLKPYIYAALALLLVGNILIWTAISSLPDDKLHVTVLDVGQGESILIRTSQGQNILVDTGPDPASACAALGRKLPFWDRKIELVILTQLQSDHISGSLELLRRYDVGRIYLPTADAGSALSREISHALKGTPIMVSVLHAGQQLSLGHDTWLTVLHPPARLLRDTSDDANNNSIALRLTRGEVSFLLTSDIGMDGERYLIDTRADLQSDVLKVGHHGSKNSTSGEFLSIVNPAAAVISAGATNRFGHPNREVMDRLIERLGAGHIFVTATNGDVDFTTDGKKLWCRCENVHRTDN